MENLKVILTVGLPASGKSTWSTNFVKENPLYCRVSRDDFRYMLSGVGFCENKIEEIIT
jgi:predicted kinase